MLRDMLKLGGRLLVFALVAGALLGYVNYITEGPIARQEQKKTVEALSRVMPGIAAEPVALQGPYGSPAVTGVWEAREGGAVAARAFKVKAAGYGGPLQLIIGLDKNNKVTGLEVLSHAETAGLGAKAAEPGFGERFLGASAPVAVKKAGAVGEGVSAITGATITTKAVAAGIDAAVAESVRLGGK